MAFQHIFGNYFVNIHVTKWGLVESCTGRVWCLFQLCLVYLDNLVRSSKLLANQPWLTSPPPWTNLMKTCMFIEALDFKASKEIVSIPYAECKTKKKTPILNNQAPSRHKRKALDELYTTIVSMLPHWNIRFEKLGHRLLMFFANLLVPMCTSLAVTSTPTSSAVPTGTKDRSQSALFFSFLFPIVFL